MPTLNHSLQLFLFTAILAFLVSCGGGGDGQVAEGGIGGTGVSQGRVTGYGSIFVNGVEYETDQAEFQVDNRSATQQDIAVGMVVRVNGSVNPDGVTGEAYQVTYSSQIIGVIEANRIGSDRALDVMGQIVNVDSDTVYDNPIDATPIETLPVNAVVEISGFTDGSGEILATWIAVRALTWSGENLMVTGLVHSASASDFSLGQLRVVPGEGVTPPENGDLITASGNRFIGAAFEAGSLVILGQGAPAVADDGDEVEIEGRITTALNDQDQFALNGQWVDASATRYSGETYALSLGRILKVSGTMQGSTLRASSIELRYDENAQRGVLGARIDISQVDASAGTLTLMGQTIQVTRSTILESDLDHETSFTLSELDASDYIKAKVYTDNGLLIASKLERDHPPRSYSVELDGIPEYVDTGRIRIFGILIDTSRVAYTFSTNSVEIHGEYADGIVIATYIDIDDEEDHHDDGDHEDDGDDHHDDGDHHD